MSINYCDFWTGFDARDNYLTDLLLREYSLLLSPKPDFLIYSVFGSEHRKYNCRKIFYSGENVRPDFSECDFAFTFDHLEDERHYRLPLYAWWDDAEKLIKPDQDFSRILKQKSRFCNFIYGNASATRRIDFMRKLSRYKTVDSAGSLMNNVGRVVSMFEKVEFLKSYKFTIAFENTSYPGYTTEKLVQPMLAQSIAIYWGNPLVHLDFNPKSFLNVHDFASDDAVIERIIEMDRDDDLYLGYLAEPFYHDNVVNRYVSPENILEQFRRIFTTPGPHTS